ncbi:hypothetical protein J416_07382 [Gracilibacillus halophilus YIM-C55.5]|uniref:Lipopolysaccharide assembly protein A domain-containing protein n=1 Tax=Gracilibacillus halophilus YIM-C55.5 TaxID=1308866 RepID=N4WLS4_9BACI|nr:lipopolysaccharide assembly protein LapA domain-containing protein [Gracilibacillus halophilus]ENH97092.1 hypothetical protein J416_07382 [Gracilibacillus halophilus YIM-C55.5]
MRGQTYILVSVLFAVIIAIFAVINVEAVEVNYLFGTGEAPLILVILFSVLMGAFVTAAVGLVRLIRLQKEIKALQQENEKLKASHSQETSHKNHSAENSNLEAKEEGHTEDLERETK